MWESRDTNRNCCVGDQKLDHMSLEVNTRTNIGEANSERRVGHSQNQHLSFEMKTGCQK